MDELMYLLLRTQREARNLSLEFNSNNKFERVAVALEKIYSELENDYEEERKTIIELLFIYSNLTKEYMKNKNPSQKAEIEKIYLELIGIMAENDPRRKAVDNLKTLVV